MAAGIAIAFVLTHSGSHSTGTKEVYGVFGNFGVAYGATAKQLTAQVGQPDQKRGNCWIYRARGGSLAGTKLIPQIALMDAVRYCFAGGVVSTIGDHWRPGAQVAPDPGPWTPPVEFGCGGKPCKVTHSP